MTEEREIEVQLIANAKQNLDELKKLLEGVSDHWGYEDPIYRFYHASYKVYWLQAVTLGIVEKLQALVSERKLNDDFMAIVQEGTGKTFDYEHNKAWLKHTRPILEAFFHAKYMLEMVVKYAAELESPPRTLPSGWAAVLYLYNLR